MVDIAPVDDAAEMLNVAFLRQLSRLAMPADISSAHRSCMSSGRYSLRELGDCLHLKMITTPSTCEGCDVPRPKKGRATVAAMLIDV